VKSGAAGAEHSESEVLVWVELRWGSTPALSQHRV